MATRELDWNKSTTKL